ncbi:serine peptidase [Metarhizium guizhouense ARSEF 977]|uniref:Serine peptidase n=1 Tax=Metarhizium guizhouense (strain ARSEF 977) TaxID=1276136 RepID=A0A0B4H316_METGA|nr:serine peptidase [Metarhizium guizhouense ARSEF 977]
MRVSSFVGIAANLLLAVPSGARINRVHLNGLPPPPPNDGSLTKKSHGPTHKGVFQQLIDHNKPELGRFSQRYWYNADDWAGPGSPIILNAPSEHEANAFYATKDSLAGRFAQTTGGAAIVLEHRYWGKSSPFNNLTTTNLQYLNLDNAIQDIIYFAHNVEQPFDLGGTSKPSKAPWVLTGCSYSGALAAWTHHLAPGTFWAYHCSSAVVEAIPNFWKYNQPIKEAIPKNCSTDMQGVMKHIDGILSDGTKDEKHALKKKFGLESLTHDDDFGAALAGGLQKWQNTVFFKTKKPNALYQMCDYLENVFPQKSSRIISDRPAVPGPEGVGTSKALDGFAKWSKEVYLPAACAEFGYWADNNTAACMDMNNKDNPMYTDLSVNNTVNRQWYWLLCNEPFEWWQVSGPDDITGLASKHAGLDYARMQCSNMFPREGNRTYGLKLGRTARETNRRTGGWGRVNTTRLMWVNGELDPWRAATVSADERPGGPLVFTPEAPVWVLPGGVHCSDVLTRNAEANPALRRVVDDVLKTMKKWVDEYYK